MTPGGDGRWATITARVTWFGGLLGVAWEAWRMTDARLELLITYVVMMGLAKAGDLLSALTKGGLHITLDRKSEDGRERSA